MPIDFLWGGVEQLTVARRGRIECDAIVGLFLSIKSPFFFSIVLSTYDVKRSRKQVTDTMTQFASDARCRAF